MPSVKVKAGDEGRRMQGAVCWVQGMVLTTTQCGRKFKHKRCTVNVKESPVSSVFTIQQLLWPVHSCASAFDGIREVKQYVDSPFQCPESELQRKKKCTLSVLKF